MGLTHLSIRLRQHARERERREWKGGGNRKGTQIEVDSDRKTMRKKEKSDGEKVGNQCILCGKIGRNYAMHMIRFSK